MQSTRSWTTSPAWAGGAPTALIVADERHVRSYLRMLLGTLGVTAVREASDGERAVELYHGHRPDFVLLDVSMPAMAGDDVLRRIRQLDPAAAVTVLVAQDCTETVNRFTRLGALGHVLKHVPREQVRAAIAEALDRLVRNDQATNVAA